MSDSDDWEVEYDRELAKETIQLTKNNGATTKKIVDNGKDQIYKTLKPQNHISDKVKDDADMRRYHESLNTKAEVELFGYLLDGCDMNPAPDSNINTNEAKTLPLLISSTDAFVALRNTTTVLKSYTDVKNLALALRPMIDRSPAKSVAWLELFTQLLDACCFKMEGKDLKTLGKKFNDAATTQNVTRRVVQQTKRKVNSSCNVKNYKEELDIFYGDNSNSDEPTEEDESDGFM
ncbi:uncharacterized protein LOC128883543 [Hylaeus volcanicus]|uniref:uncharacterized protein LOC128883543 n=1 Tax=Hylaeus volcanicus TaxID=313075 RepID=UPI0023B87BBB|nr:uncharacterized protein LOC128883543 [Hylaeus volcanicus]